MKLGLTCQENLVEILWCELCLLWVEVLHGGN